MYAIIDTRILVTEILCLGGNQSRAFTPNLEWKTVLWKKVFNFKKRLLRRQEVDGEIRFRGTLSTDGVGVTVTKSSVETLAGGRRVQAVAAQENKFQYITEVNRLEFQQHLATNCIVVYPNRRDIMYCMHESSTIESPLTLRFTSSLLKKNSGRKSNTQINNRVMNEHGEIQNWLAILTSFDKKK